MTNARTLPHAMLLAVFLAAALFAGGGAFAADTRDFHDHFPQYPGFSQYFAANPPASSPPSGAEQVLLVRLCREQLK